MRTGILARGGVGLMLVAGFAAAAAAGPMFAAVARIEPGQWQLRTPGSDAAPRTLCIGDAAMLLHYSHGSAQCQRFVIANDPDLASVRYTCPGAGHGQTSVKVATPRTFTLETQGIANGAPFDEYYEARRIGECPAGAAAAR